MEPVSYFSLEDNKELIVLETGPHYEYGLGLFQSQIPLKYQLARSGYVITFYLDNRQNFPNLGIHASSDITLFVSLSMKDSCIVHISNEIIFIRKISPEDYVAATSWQNCDAEIHEGILSLIIYNDNGELGREEVNLKLRPNGYNIYSDA